MTFTHNGKKFRIDFERDQFNPPVAVLTEYRGKKLISAITTCLVWERPEAAKPEEEILAYHGRSLCSVDDRFVKKEGRERSIKRAADQIPDRVLRGKVLSAYFTRKDNA